MAISRFPARRATALATILAFATGASSFGAVRAQQPAPAQLSQLQIQHDPIPCVTTTAGSAVDAQVNPGPEVSVSHVLWRAANTKPYYYYTVMTGTPPSFEGLIPRAEEKTTAVEYYVEALDRVSLSQKTPGYVAPVRLANVCAVKSILPGKNGLGLTIGLTDPNQPPLPPGFRKEDIAKVILVTGAIVTLAVAMQMFAGTSAGSSAAASGAGAGAGAGGGGISTGVLVGAGVAVAAGVGIAVANKSKSNTPTPTPVVNHFIVADVTWSGTGDVDILLINPSGQSVGTRIPVDDCSLTQSRTERVILQGGSVPAGNYQVQVTGKSCGAGTPAIIATNVTAQVDGVQKCSTFVGVPVTQTVNGCSFTVP